MTFRAKYHHAIEELNRIEGDMDGWVGTQPYVLAEHKEAGTGERVYTAMLREDTEPMWNIRVGECLYNFRSSLDHLAYDLALKHTPAPLPDKIARGSEFPIFGNRPPAPSELADEIGGIHPDAQAIIEALQPHYRGDPAYERDPLWILDRLCNIDKHRELHVVVPANKSIQVITPPGTTTQNVRQGAGRVEDGAEVLRCSFVPDPDVQVNVVVNYFISFSEGAPAFGEPVIATLRSIQQYIADDVFGPLARFLL